MKLTIEARRTVSGEPIFVKAENLPENVTSAVTEDGRRFPAQKTADGVLIVADVKQAQPLEVTLTDAPTDGGVEFIFADDHKALNVYINKKLFTSYIFDRGFIKPFLGPVYTAEGTSYTRLDLETKEHPHQRSVFFAVGDVDGIDFWNENTPERGEERHKGFDGIAGGTAYGSFAARNVWTDHTGRLVIDEKRKFTFYNQPEACRYVDAEVTFTASYKGVRFGSTKEAGPLGIRVNPEMCGSNTGIIRNAYGALKECECWGRSAPWCDYSGTIAGKKYGITVFDNEDNERYPTSWHIRDYGLFAANNLYFKGGFDIPKGNAVTYKYRICFHEGDINATDRFLVYAK